jgi:hypothetical protein
MYEYRPPYGDRLCTYWHLFAGNRVLDFKYNSAKKQLTEELLIGQPSSPKEFLDLLEQELKALAK